MTFCRHQFFFDKTLFGYLFNKWIIERCNWQTEQITSWNVWIFQYYNRWLRLNCLQYIWQRILTKRAAGARSKAKLQVLWPCCALVVLGTLGDSQFLVRGYRNMYVDTICVSVFFSSSIDDYSAEQCNILHFGWHWYLVFFGLHVLYIAHAISILMITYACTLLW